MGPATFAEAGLSDCVKTDMDCMPGFGTFVLLAGLGILGIVVWLSVLMGITLAIVESPETPKRRVAWILLVWLVPVVGAVVWFARPVRMAT